MCKKNKIYYTIINSNAFQFTYMLTLLSKLIFFYIYIQIYFVIQSFGYKKSFFKKDTVIIFKI